MPAPNDTFSDSSRRDLSNDTLFEVGTLIADGDTLPPILVHLEFLEAPEPDRVWPQKCYPYHGITLLRRKSNSFSAPQALREGAYAACACEGAHIASGSGLHQRRLSLPTFRNPGRDL